jgi:hypothetical protein
LNINKEKWVIAPGQWFKDNEMNKLSHSIIPENWIRL